VQRGEFADIGQVVVLAAEQPLGEQRRPVAAQDRGHFAEAELRVVLHAPEHAARMAELGGLDRRHGIGREHRHLARRHGDLVEVDRRRIVGGGPAGEQGMRAAGFGRRDVAGEADLAPARIGPHLAAGRDRRDLDPPAGAEEGRPGGVDGAGEFHLPRHCGHRMVGMQRRAGEHHGVVALQARRIGQVGALVGRHRHVAHGIRLDAADHLGIGLAVGQAVAGPVGLATFARVAVDDEKP